MWNEAVFVWVDKLSNNEEIYGQPQVLITMPGYTEAQKCCRKQVCSGMVILSVKSVNILPVKGAVRPSSQCSYLLIVGSMITKNQKLCT